MTPAEREQYRARLAGPDMNQQDPGTNDGSSYYTGERGDRFIAIAFRGRAVRAAFHHWWRDAASRDAFVEQWIEGLRERAANKPKERKPHSLQVGDVLVASWGWEQTNQDFYEVIAVRGAAVDLAELQQDTKSTGDMKGTCVPLPGKYTSVRIMGKRPAADNRVKLTSFSSARPWDGTPMRWSNYA